MEPAYYHLNQITGFKINDKMTRDNDEMKTGKSVRACTDLAKNQ
jgi:hypothetical protein